MSIEFRALEERRENDLRIIERAELAGVGLVESPSYPASRVEIRQAGTLRAQIPYDSRLACECYKNSGTCGTVSFNRGSLELPDGLVAVWKNFAAPLASKSKGTLRVSDSDEGLFVTMDLPDTSWGEDIVASSEGVELYVRPLFDPTEIDATEVQEAGETVAKISKVPVRALLVGPTPNGDGWPEAKITPSREGRRSHREMLSWL